MRERNGSSPINRRSSWIVESTFERTRPSPRFPREICSSACENIKKLKMENERSQRPNPRQDLLASTTKAEREERNRIWTTTNRTKIHDIAHHFYQKIPNNISRKERIAMTRLRIGHSKITHEYLLSKTEPPFCNQQITTQHLLHECRKYRNQRSKYGLNQNTALTCQKQQRNVT